MNREEANKKILRRNEEITLLYKTGEYRQVDLAIKYSLTERWIREILRGTIKPHSYKSTYWRYPHPLDLDKIGINDNDEYFYEHETKEVGDNAPPKIIWTSLKWKNGPPLGIPNSMIKYQDNRYNGSFYDEDDFWKFTI